MHSPAGPSLRACCSKFRPLPPAARQLYVLWVFWLARPSYFRWAAAVLLIAFSFYFEVRPDPGILHPFAATNLAVGTALDDAMVDWRKVPQGLLPEVDPHGVLRIDVSAGEPLTPSMVGGTPVAPEGWWAIEIPIPAGTTIGAEVRLVVDTRATPRVIPGVVVRVVESDSFEGTMGLVAVPELEVGAAAAAAADSSLEVLVGS